jgi:hypothetical protein
MVTIRHWEALHIGNINAVQLTITAKRTKRVKEHPDADRCKTGEYFKYPP